MLHSKLLMKMRCIIFVFSIFLFAQQSYSDSLDLSHATLTTSSPTYRRNFEDQILHILKDTKNPEKIDSIDLSGHLTTNSEIIQLLLRFKNLKNLNISGNCWNALILGTLGQLSHLIILNMGGNPMTAISANQQNSSILARDYLHYFTDLPQLESLNMMTDAIEGPNGLQPLTSMKRLRTLNLSLNRPIFIPSGGVAYGNIEWSDVDAAVRQLAQFSQLTSLSIEIDLRKIGVFSTSNPPAYPFSILQIQPKVSILTHEEGTPSFINCPQSQIGASPYFPPAAAQKN